MFGEKSSLKVFTHFILCEIVISKKLFEFVANNRFSSEKLEKNPEKTPCKQILPNLHGFLLFCADEYII